MENSLKGRIVMDMTPQEYQQYVKRKAKKSPLLKNTALAFGVVGGLFCDFGLSGTLGFHALVLGVLCFFISLLVRVYLQSNIATALLTGIVGIGLTVCLQWFFLYFFRYSHPSYAFTHHYLPKYLYTLLFLPLVYFLNRGLSQALRPQEESRL